MKGLDRYKLKVIKSGVQKVITTDKGSGYPSQYFVSIDYRIDFLQQCSLRNF